MEVEHILRDFGLILGAGLVSQLIATVTKLPEMVVLVAAGALIGPSVLGLVSNPLGGTGSQLLFNIGVALILFHGGTGISLRVISRTAVGLGLLVLPGIVITALIVALVVSPVFGVAFPVALLVGAVLAATDPAILIPLFDRLKGGWTREEIAFISWCRETGVIPAAVASLLLARGVEGAEIAVSLVALAVCVTLLLQATTAGYLARRLGIVSS